MNSFFFDIDGTLIDKNTKEITLNTFKVLRELKQKGHKIALATGRSPKNVDSRLIQIGFDYYICFNGAVILDEKFKVLRTVLLEKKEIRILMNFYKELDNGIIFCCLDNNYSFKGKMIFDEISEKESGTKKIESDLIELKSFYEIYSKNPICAITYIEPKNIKFYKEIMPELEFTSCGWANYFDITKKGINKGDAADYILNNMTETVNKVISFGDDDNDVSLLKKSDIGISMGDASFKAVENADYITGTASNDGVYKAIIDLNLY